MDEPGAHEVEAVVAALHLYVDEDECVCDDPDFAERVKCVACVGRAALTPFVKSLVVDEVGHEERGNENDRRNT